MVLLNSVGGYVESFISSLELNERSKRLARILLKSKEDCQLFYIEFLGKDQQVYDDLLNYRCLKLAYDNNKNYDHLDLNSIVKTKAFLENVFMQPLSDIESSIIINSINSEIITFQNIYKKFKSSPRDNIMKHVL